MTQEILIGVFEQSSQLSNAIGSRFPQLSVVSCRDIAHWRQLVSSQSTALLVCSKRVEDLNAFIMLGIAKELQCEAPFWLVGVDASEEDSALYELAGFSKIFSSNAAESICASVSAWLNNQEVAESTAAPSNETGIFEWNLVENSYFFSPGCRQILHCTENSSLETMDDWMNIVIEEDAPRVKAKMGAFLHSELQEFSVEHRIDAGDNTHNWIRVTANARRDAVGKIHLIEGKLTDITAEKQHRADLMNVAFYGAVGLANQTLFQVNVRRVIESAKRRGTKVSTVVLLDIDRVQHSGEDVGLNASKFVDHVASTLKKELRVSDTIALVDTHTFGIVLEQLPSVRDAQRLVFRLLDCLSSPFSSDGKDVKITCSAGIAASLSSYNQVDDLIRDAETALLKAKLSHRSHVEVFDTYLAQSEIDQLRMDMDLHHAFEREEFRILYQPIIAADTGNVVGLEALIRWRHPIKGLLTPNYFLEAAEASGLIRSLSTWALTTASKQVREWQERFKRRVSFTLNFNVGETELQSTTLASDVIAALSDSGMSPEQLRLEISESCLIERNERIINNLTALSGHGIKLCIHDFGAKHAPINALINYPVSAIKLHPTLAKAVSDKSKLALIKSVIELANTLKIEVAALGVEEMKQSAQLKSLGCGIFQGHAVALPTDAKHTPQVIKKGVQINW